MSGARTTIDFTIGARRVVAVPRRLERIDYTLEQLLAAAPLALPAPPPGSDGYRLSSVPPAALAAVTALPFAPVIGAVRRYRRHYIAMQDSYADYLARFSGKTRATLLRKQRKLAEANGGALDVAAFATPDGLAQFFAEALPLSRRTYQARLLNAALPESAEGQAAALALAGADRVRAFILRLHGTAIAYLYLPVEGRTLNYALLGYDPDHARLSPGTVLQLAALERLYGEGRFAYFDFTEGEGAHKELFGTDAAEAVSFVALRPALANRAVLGALGTFDAGVAGLRHAAERTGLLARARRVLRG